MDAFGRKFQPYQILYVAGKDSPVELISYPFYKSYESVDGGKVWKGEGEEFVMIRTTPHDSTTMEEILVADILMCSGLQIGCTAPATGDGKLCLFHLQIQMEGKVFANEICYHGMPWDHNCPGCEWDRKNALRPLPETVNARFTS